MFSIRVTLTPGQAPETSGIETIGYFWDMGTITGIYTHEIDIDTVVYVITDSNDEATIVHLDVGDFGSLKITSVNGLASNSVMTFHTVGSGELMFVFNQVGAGDDQLTNAQIVLSAMDFDFDFTDYGCKPTTQQVTGLDVYPVPPNYAVYEWPQIFSDENVLISVETDYFNVDPGFKLSSTTTYTDTNGDICHPQPIVFTGFPAEGDKFCYDLTANQEDQIETIEVSQCQELEFTIDITYDSGRTPDYLTYSLEEQYLNISLADVGPEEEGPENITIYVDLDANSLVNASTYFELFLYSQPEVHFTAWGGIRTYDDDDGKFYLNLFI